MNVSSYKCSPTVPNARLHDSRWNAAGQVGCSRFGHQGLAIRFGFPCHHSISHVFQSFTYDVATNASWNHESQREQLKQRESWRHDLICPQEQNGGLAGAVCWAELIELGSRVGACGDTWLAWKGNGTCGP